MEKIWWKMTLFMQQHCLGMSQWLTPAIRDFCWLQTRKPKINHPPGALGHPCSFQTFPKSNGISSKSQNWHPKEWQNSNKARQQCVAIAWLHAGHEAWHYAHRQQHRPGNWLRKSISPIAGTGQCIGKLNLCLIVISSEFSYGKKYYNNNHKSDNLLWCQELWGIGLGKISKIL